MADGHLARSRVMDQPSGLTPDQPRSLVRHGSRFPRRVVPPRATDYGKSDLGSPDVKPTLLGSTHGTPTSATSQIAQPFTDWT